GSFATAARLNNKDRADLNKKITYPRGSYTDIVYKSTPNYFNGGALLNPDLPMVLDTVESITNNDGLGNSSATNYKYEGGEFNFTDSYNRQFAGYAKVTKTTSNS